MTLPAVRALPQTHRQKQGVDLNHRPPGYEPSELPDCSTLPQGTRGSPGGRSSVSLTSRRSRPSIRTDGDGQPPPLLGRSRARFTTQREPTRAVCHRSSDASSLGGPGERLTHANVSISGQHCAYPLIARQAPTRRWGSRRDGSGVRTARDRIQKAQGGREDHVPPRVGSDARRCASR